MYRYMLRKKGRFLLFLVLLVVSCVMGSLFSLIMSAIVDCAGKTAEELLWTLLGSIVYVVVYNLLALSYRCMKAGILTDARYYLKKDVFTSLMGRTVGDFDVGNSAEYMNELSNNLNLFENVYWGNYIGLLEGLISFVGAAAICIALQPTLLVLMIILALLSMGVTRLTTAPLEKSMEGFAKSAEVYTAEIKDDFGGFRLAYSYGIIPFILKKHDKKNRSMEDANRRNTNCRILCAYAGNFVGLLSTVLVMAMASYFSLKGMFSAGMVIAFGHLIGNIISPIESMPSIIANFRASKPLLERFRNLLVQKEKAGTKKIDGFSEEIALDGVSFGYEENREVLRKLSFRFRAGKHYAIVGKSGCGKSTLLSLLLGYYPDYGGSISYDGIELRELKRECLGSIVAYVSQDTFLFQDTIQNNITLYDEKYTRQEIEAAVEQAGLKELVDSLPEGLSTMIDENGKNFSGGEKQRLSLAKALLRKSKVLLLDEFTANLDKETARKLESRILALEGCLVITVTHRLEPDTLQQYDGILELDQ